MQTRLFNTITLFAALVGIAAASAWSPDDHDAAAASTTLSGCIAHAFPTAEAGFARRRAAAAG